MSGPEGGAGGSAVQARAPGRERAHTCVNVVNACVYIAHSDTAAPFGSGRHLSAAAALGFLTAATLAGTLARMLARPMTVISAAEAFGKSCVFELMCAEST